jgi:hypothetical protein
MVSLIKPMTDDTYFSGLLMFSHICDTDDTMHPPILMLIYRRHLYALSRALRDGCDVRGYFYWVASSLFDFMFTLLIHALLIDING